MDPPGAPPRSADPPFTNQWVPCDNCQAWRKHPSWYKKPERWVCADNIWAPSRAHCHAPQEIEADVPEAPVEEDLAAREAYLLGTHPSLLKNKPATGATKISIKIANTKLTPATEELPPGLALKRLAEDLERVGEVTKRARAAKPVNEARQDADDLFESVNRVVVSFRTLDASAKRLAKPEGGDFWVPLSLLERLDEPRLEARETKTYTKERLEGLELHARNLQKSREALKWIAESLERPPAS